MKAPVQRAPVARGRPRTGARVAAVQALFQSEQAGESPEAVIEQFVRHRLGPNEAEEGWPEGRVPEADVRLFARLVRATATGIEAIDAALAEVLAKDWPLEKLDPVLRALLRAAGAELMQPHEPPMRVVINEYLDVAHGFFAGDEPKFANGVMEALARRFRADEFGRG